MSLQTGCFDKAYVEITNVCNASCSFCPKTSRPARFMTDNEFHLILNRLQGRVTHLYFHLMGEPLLHPLVTDFAIEAKARGFAVMISSNGILSSTVGRELVSTGAVKKISLSLHSYEANAFGLSLESYLDGCFSLAEEASKNGVICALRLWNQGAPSENNEIILAAIRARFGQELTPIRSGYRLSHGIFLEWGDRFSWPIEEKGELPPTFCHALRNQIGVLSDGTVVPCCLDSEGKMPLGNLYTETLDDILHSARAKRLYDGFSSHRAIEELCLHCQYATRFDGTI